MATHSSMLTREIPWTEESGGGEGGGGGTGRGGRYSPWGLKRVGQHLATKQQPLRGS